MSLLSKALQPVAKKIGQEVAENIAPASKKISDWGWRGGKPGELTGKRFNTLVNKADKRAEKEAMKITGAKTREIIDENPEMFSVYDDLFESYVQPLRDQARKQFAGTKFASTYPDETMREFATLENANIPREYTGKLLPGLHAYLRNVNPMMSLRPYLTDKLSQSVSKLMKDLTPEQRDTFMSLLPEWNGHLDELAEAAKLL